MARKLLFLAVSMLLVLEKTWGCDACGCSALGSGVGLLATFRQNTIGLQYHYTPFSSALTHTHGTHDYFHTVDIALRLQVVDRIKVQFAQPYRVNIRQHSGVTQSLAGLGDTRLVLSYVAMDRTPEVEGISIYGEFGIGVKSPTGMFDANLSGRDLPENFNLGNGAWAGILQSTIGIHLGNTGVALSGNYQKNWNPADAYQFGDQATVNMYVFHQFYPIKNWMMLTPYAGLAGERIAQDRQADSRFASATGGGGLYATMGLNTQIRKWIIGGNLWAPCLQSYAGKEIKAHPRFSIQFSRII